MKKAISISIAVNILILILSVKFYFDAKNSNDHPSTTNVERNNLISLSSKNDKNSKVLQKIIQKLDKSIKPEDCCFQCPDLASYLSAHGITQLSSDDLLNILNEDIAEKGYDRSEENHKEDKTAKFDPDEIFQETIEIGEQMLYSETREEAFHNMVKFQALTNLLSEEDRTEVEEYIQNNND